MRWFYNASTTKSLGDLDRLVHDVLLAPDFRLEDLDGFRAKREAERLDTYRDEPESPFTGNDGWIETSVKISLPCEKVCHTSESMAPVYEVQGLYYRQPLEVIKAAFRETTAETFHLSPFEEYWQASPDSPPERLYSEMYNSDTYIKEHDHVRAQAKEPGCTLETVIASIMLWSDSTQLATFGTASLWPIYLYLGNQSKYARVKPTSFAAHHLAYIPKVTNFLL
jgi:hypothetical protein